MLEASNGDVPRDTARGAAGMGEVSRGEDKELRSWCNGERSKGAAVGVEISSARGRGFGEMSDGWLDMVILWGCRKWGGSRMQGPVHGMDKDGKCWYRQEGLGL